MCSQFWVLKISCSLVFFPSSVLFGSKATGHCAGLQMWHHTALEQRINDRMHNVCFTMVYHSFCKLWLYVGHPRRQGHPSSLSTEFRTGSEASVGDPGNIRTLDTPAFLMAQLLRFRTYELFSTSLSSIEIFSAGCWPSLRQMSPSLLQIPICLALSFD